MEERPLEGGEAFAAGRYQLERRLGSGSFGEVWRAWDALEERSVALKVLLAEWMETPVVLERFEREIRASTRLQHPGIVQILDTGFCPDSGRPFYAMELVEGGPIHEVPPSLGVWLEVFDQLMAALSYAHARGVVHRDLKPDNILVARQGGGWACKVLDFGIARLEGHNRKVTGAGMVLGTPIYMSPEQAFGEASSAGPASDLYAAGVILYELLSGAPPFHGSYMTLVEAHLLKPLPPLRPRPELGEVPASLEALVRELTAKRYAERPESAVVVRERLRPLLAGLRGVAPTQRLEVGAGLLPPGEVSAAEVDMSAAPRADELAPLNLARLQVLRLRDPPPPGRAQAKAALWESALRVGGARRPQVVVLTGAPGMGKGRLARWLAEMGAEHGTLRSFRVPLPDRGEVPVGMHAALHRMLHYPRLERQILGFWVDHTLPNPSEETRGALLDFMLDALTSGALERREMEQAVESWSGLWWELLRSRAMEPTPQALLVTLEVPRADTPLDAAATWLHGVLQRAEAEGVPILALWTVPTPTEELPRALHALGERHALRHLHLGPLDRSELTSLARGVVPSLDEGVLEALQGLSQGSPFFARELLLSWLESGQLAREEGVWRLRLDAARSLPERLEDVVADKISDFLRGFGASANGVMQALMTLAFLGSSFPLAHAQITLDRSGVPASALVRAGILEQRRGGPEPEVAFSTGLMQEVLIARGRAMNMVNLLRRYATEAQLAGALEALLDGNWALAERSVHLARQLLDERQAPRYDEARLHVLAILALIAYQRRESATLEHLAQHLAELAREAEDDETADRVLGPAELWRGIVAERRGAALEARLAFRNARAHAVVAHHPVAHIWALVGLARNAETRADRVSADRYGDELRTLCRSVGEEDPIARRWVGLALRILQSLQSARTQPEGGAAS